MQRGYRVYSLERAEVGDVFFQAVIDEGIERTEDIEQSCKGMSCLLVVKSATDGTAVEFALESRIHTADILHHFQLDIKQFGDAHVSCIPRYLLRESDSRFRAEEYDTVESAPFRGYVIDIHTVREGIFREKEYALGRGSHHPVVESYEPVDITLLVDKVRYERVNFSIDEWVSLEDIRVRAMGVWRVALTEQVAQRR